MDLDRFKDYVACKCESSVCVHVYGHTVKRKDARPAPVQYLRGEIMCEPCIKQYQDAGYGVEDDAR